jgi:RNAse (barnase) inhibitor barstar
MAFFKLINQTYQPTAIEGQKIAILDGQQAQTLEDFYTHIADSLVFPAHFGRNLDALDEMLNDLEWLPETHIVLVVQHYEDWLSEENEETKEVIISIIGNAAEEWESFGKNKKRLSIVIEDVAEAQTDLEFIGLEYEII